MDNATETARPSMSTNRAKRIFKRISLDLKDLVLNGLPGEGWPGGIGAWMDESPSQEVIETDIKQLERAARDLKAVLAFMRQGEAPGSSNKREKVCSHE